MTSIVSIVARLMSVKGMHIDSVESTVRVEHKYGVEFEQETLLVHARPFKRIQHECPICRRACPKYDTKYEKDSTWRGPNLNGIPVFISYRPDRICCPDHGVLTEFIPWQDGNSRFTASFNDEVTFLSLSAPKTVVSEFMDINWRTVGNCIEATHNRIEPDVSVRLHNLRRISVDETSYKKGHKYITVVTDMDKNEVVWVHEQHGLEIFRLFAELLTPEERQNIRIVAGDGAQWIDTITKEYFTNAKRCVDPFHVVGWANEALDEVRKSVAASARMTAVRERKKMEQEADEKQAAWLEEYHRYQDALKEVADSRIKPGRKSKHILEQMAFIQQFESEYSESMEILKNAKKGQLTEEQQARLDELEKKAGNLKGCKYALGMKPDTLSEINRDRLALIEVSSPELYEAYKLKEQLRVILHMSDRDLAEKCLNQWIEDALNSGFKPFADLAVKIRDRHMKNILNTIQYQENSSRSEQLNGKIKGLIKTARGFHNLEHLFAMIYLSCSSLVIPLNNRYRPTPEKNKETRELNRTKRKQREETKRGKNAA